MFLPWAVQLVREQVPFVPHGRSRKGLDCWGIVFLAYKENLNVDLPSYQEEYNDIHEYDVLKDIFVKEKQTWLEVEKGQEKAGDVVLINMRNRPIHVGLVIKSGSMIHIEEKIDVCIEKYRNWRWEKRIVGFYRHPSCSSTSSI